MKNIIEDFFATYFNTDLSTVYGDHRPKEMMASEVDAEGWFTWKPIKGTLTNKDYQKVEQEFNVVFPKSFIEWHKTYFFLGCDCSLIRLPASNPNRPLEEVIRELDYDMAKGLIEERLYPFAQDGGDAGPLVFDASEKVEDNEFPIRLADTGLAGLSEVIFSSFPKLLECVAHYLKDTRPGKYEVFYDFLTIDPEGAGKTGVDYWLELAKYTKMDYEAGY